MSQDTVYPHNQARIICASDYLYGMPLMTFELTYPRYIHAELMTHRVFSRNAQSSRAIPVEKRLKRVRANPVMPIRWGANQPGMQAKDEEVEDIAGCELDWREAAQAAAFRAEGLMNRSLHKQWGNRLLEPFDTITVLVTCGFWDNFFSLRCHVDAQPEFEDLAWKMAHLYYYDRAPAEIQKKVQHLRVPCRRLQKGEWHLPLIRPDEEGKHSWEDLIKFSVARCARVTRLNHDGSEPKPEKDIELHGRLLKDGHMSPFEHQARPILPGEGQEGESHRLCGNLPEGWVQYRKTLPKEVRTAFNYEEAWAERVASGRRPVY